MMAQNHIIAAIVISKLIPNPILAIALSFLSHFILDFFNYPSAEMGIRLQDDLTDKKAQITFIFVASFEFIISAMIIGSSIYLNQITIVTTISIIASLLPDIWGQVIPIIKRKPKSAIYSHNFDPIKSPVFKIIINQGFTIAGFIAILFIK